MKPSLVEKWNRAFEQPATKVEVGRDVVCDLCGQDWTERPESGGFLFLSASYCPDCAVEGEKTIERFDEQRYIVARCGAESFADFIRRERGPDAGITVTVVKR